MAAPPTAVKGHDVTDLSEEAFNARNGVDWRGSGPPITRGASPLEAKIGDAVDEALRRQGEVGIQVAAVVNGSIVVDVSGGVSDTVTMTPVDASTLFPIFSITKGVLTCAVLAGLHDKHLQHGTAIAEVWPEFAQNGKQGVTLKHVLTHSAGIPAMPEGTDVRAMCNWDLMVERVARLAPLWTPGSRVGYHAYTFGWVVGEALRRGLKTEATVGEIVQDLICRPAGVGDFWIGLPEALHHRVASIYCGPQSATPEKALIQAIPPGIAINRSVYGRSLVRRASLPGAGGIATATALARIFGGVANGNTIVRAERITQARGVHRDELDLVTGRRNSRGLGFYVGSPWNHDQPAPFDAESPAFGHPGAGGSVAWADPELNAGFAILHNRLKPAGWEDPTVQHLVQVLVAGIRHIKATDITLR